MGYRTKLIKLVTFLGGLYFFLEFVLPEKIGGVKIDQYNDQISNGLTVIGAMALGLGLVNLIMVHGSKIIFRRSGWVDSSALLLGLVLMTVITAADWISSLRSADQTAAVMSLREFSDRIKKDYEGKVEGVPTIWVRNAKLQEASNKAVADAEAMLAANLVLSIDAEHPDAKLFSVARADLSSAVSKVKEAAALLPTAQTAEVDFSSHEKLAPALGSLGASEREFTRLKYKHTRLKQLYDLLYQGFFVSLGAAMFSLLGFYIAAAAYRAFRIKSAESALMMTAAVIVMLGQIPFGIWLWDALPDMRLWLLSVPNSGAFRAIKIGAAVAGLVMAFRMWFSIETETFAEKSK
jgi:ABC-type multidrug transport system fused ATPase/permease subunit